MFCTPRFTLENRRSLPIFPCSRPACAGHLRMHWKHFAAVLGGPQLETEVHLCESCGGQVFFVDEIGKLSSYCLLELGGRLGLTEPYGLSSRLIAHHDRTRAELHPADEPQVD